MNETSAPPRRPKRRWLGLFVILILALAAGGAVPPRGTRLERGTRLFANDSMVTDSQLTQAEQRIASAEAAVASAEVAPAVWVSAY